MARKTKTGSGDPTTVAPYSFSHSCGQSVQLDEVPDNRVTECPHCGDPAIIPETLGQERALGLVPDEEE